MSTLTNPRLLAITSGDVSGVRLKNKMRRVCAEPIMATVADFELQPFVTEPRYLIMKQFLVVHKCNSMSLLQVHSAIWPFNSFHTIPILVSATIPNQTHILTKLAFIPPIYCLFIERVLNFSPKLIFCVHFACRKTVAKFQRNTNIIHRLTSAHVKFPDILFRSVTTKWISIGLHYSCAAWHRLPMFPRQFLSIFLSKSNLYLLENHQKPTA